VSALGASSRFGCGYFLRSRVARNSIGRHFLLFLGFSFSRGGELMKKIVLGICALSAWAVAVTALGQTGEITPIKTPPLRNSDIYTQPINRHFNGTDAPAELPGAGWAGVRVKIHVLDASEVDVDALVPAPGYLIRYPGSPDGTGLPPGIYTGPIPDPFGPRSNNVGSVPIIVTMIHPLAQQSGINPPFSHIEPIVNLVLHAKNTSARNNSDIDLTLMFEDIWHTRERTVPGSTQIHFPNSVRKWSFSNVNDDPSSWEPFHITGDPVFDSMYRMPEGPPLEDPNGHWAHIPGSLVFHNFTGFVPGSDFFAYMAATVLGVGIEHVPEPVSAALLGVGVGCALMGGYSRKRRCALQ
jgi:hypothetical protein